MKTTAKFLRVAMVLAMAAALSACGVKSEPAQFDSSSYPRVYPAPTEEIKAVPGTGTRSSGTVYTRRPAKDASGVYTPPAPATEILAQ